MHAPSARQARCRLLSRGIRALLVGRSPATRPMPPSQRSRARPPPRRSARSRDTPPGRCAGIPMLRDIHLAPLTADHSMAAPGGEHALRHEHPRGPPIPAYDAVHRPARWSTSRRTSQPEGRGPGAGSHPLSTRGEGAPRFEVRHLAIHGGLLNPHRSCHIELAARRRDRQGRSLALPRRAAVHRLLRAQALDRIRSRGPPRRHECRGHRDEDERSRRGREDIRVGASNAWHEARDDPRHHKRPGEPK